MSETKRKTILLVDDEHHMVDAQERMFRAQGWSVLKATTVAEAMKLLNRVDVVISDYGIDTGEGVTQLIESSKVPVIIFTGKIRPIQYPWVLYKPSPFSELFELANVLSENVPPHTDIRPLNQ